MRTPIIAGNWKMHKTLAESVTFVRELAPAIAPYTDTERVVCPTFVALAGVADALVDTGIKVGAQNIHWEESGAFTSQISPLMLQGLVEYVIVGHSECRAYLGDTDEIVNRKVHAALSHGLKPIVAVGESEAQYDAGETRNVVERQVRIALQDVASSDMQHIVMAYEPIWAIGTGKNASSEIAQNIIGGVIRATLHDLYGNEIAQDVRIQYGGSVKPDNMAEYMQQPDVDGALVGGASLKVDAFTDLVRIASEVKGSSSG